jgi:integrase
MGKLSALSVKRISKPGRHGDGDGLYLHVAPAGTKSWVQRIVINDRRRDIGLGAYPTVSLAQARSLATSNRTAVSEGRDPLAEKQLAKEAARNPAPSVPAFAVAALRVIELRRPTWSNPKHAAQWTSTLERYAFPVIGKKPVDEITPRDALDVLEPIWTAKNETAGRVRQRMGTIMDWAVTHGYRLDNPAGKALLKVLPPVNREPNHHPALPYSQVGWAIAKVRESTANLPTKLAFEFLVLTAARSGQVRNANWGEILWDRRTWEISAIKMKARRPHRVPLSDRAMEILHEAWPITGPDGLIFPSNPGGSVASDMTYNVMLRRLGIPAVPHGFRSSFTDWAEEQLSGYSPAADAALAHQENNKTKKAYKRTDFFMQRIGLMQEWADYVADRERVQALAVRDLTTAA